MTGVPALVAVLLPSSAYALMVSIMKLPKGFTVVELMVVIVILAILTTIGVLSYRGSQARAHEAAVQADLHSIAGSMANRQFDDGEILWWDSGTESAFRSELSNEFDLNLDSYAGTGAVFSYSFIPEFGDRNPIFAAKSESGKAFIYINGSVREFSDWHNTAGLPAQVNGETIGGGSPCIRAWTLTSLGSWQRTSCT